MKFGSFGCALVIGAALLPAAALADDPRDPLKQENIFRVHLIRQIDRCSAGRDICRGFQKYALAFFRNAVQLIPCLSYAAGGLIVYVDLCQNIFVAATASRV